MPASSHVSELHHLELWRQRQPSLGISSQAIPKPCHQQGQQGDPNSDFIGALP